MAWKLCSCTKDENGDATRDADPECPDCDGRGVVLVSDCQEMVKDLLALAGM